MLQRAVEALQRHPRTKTAVAKIGQSRVFPKTWVGWIRLGALLTLVFLAGALPVAYELLGLLPRHPAVSVSLVGDEDPPPALSGARQQSLLDVHRPVLYFAPGEYWRPIPVSVFIRDALLEQEKDKNWSLARRLNPPTEETLPPGAHFRLNQTACLASEGAACYEGLAGRLENAPTVVYGRAWRNESGAHREIGYVLQYWLFYYFDDWRNSQRDPSIWQLHEGDWEVLNVGLDRKERPVYAAYSQHCSGVRRSWSHVARTRDDHSKVYVAFGSHANYFSPGAHPVKRKCFPAKARSLVDRYHLQDVAGRNDPVGPGQSPDLVVLPLPVRTPWLSFEGSWGEAQEILWIDRRGRRHHFGIGTSPLGPAQQSSSLWVDPVEETFARWPKDQISGRVG